MQLIINMKVWLLDLSFRFMHTLCVFWCRDVKRASARMVWTGFNMVEAMFGTQETLLLYVIGGPIQKFGIAFYCKY